MTTGKLTQLIHEKKVLTEERRDYIGASLIGDSCLRKVWYHYTGAETASFSAKQMITFDIGKRLEVMMLDLLREAGLEIITSAGRRDQLHFIDKDYPEFQGNCDAVIMNPETILEIKTAKDSSFKLFVNKGLKKWNYTYYCQLQSYMGLSGILNAYMLVLNKDSSEIWDEFVPFDEIVFLKMKERVKMVLDAKTPPPKVSGDPIWFQCKLCQYNKICHG